MWIKLAIALIIPVLLLVILIAYLRQQKRQAGERLLILPISKLRRFTLIALSTALILIGVYVMSYATELENSFYTGIGGGFCGVASTFWLQLIFPTEFREQGIMFAGSLIRWSRIRSYKWQDSEYLLLKFKRWNWQKGWKIRVAPAQRSQVEHILREKLIDI